jgi:hypothetical protein
MRIAYHFGFSSLLYVDSIEFIGLKDAGIIYEDWVFPFLIIILFLPLPIPVSKFLLPLMSYQKLT